MNWSCVQYRMTAKITLNSDNVNPGSGLFETVARDSYFTQCPSALLWLLDSSSLHRVWG